MMFMGLGIGEIPLRTATGRRQPLPTIGDAARFYSRTRR
jgi:hypothetical protein